MVINTPVSIHDFEEFIYLPENSEKLLEYVCGEIFEKVSTNYSSMIGATVGFQIMLHMKTNNIKGHVTGADGGYNIGEDRYIPDVSFMSYTRQPKFSREAYNPLAPDLAVEVISPTDSEKKLRVKIANYLSEKVVVWVVNPDDETVEIYQAGYPVTVLNKEQTLDGAPVFPQLKLPVSDIFPVLDDEAGTD